MTGAAGRAVFLDRDGTLIEDLDYAREPERVRLLAGVAQALSQLRASGFQLVVVSNQSGIGRGIISEREARAVHERFVALLTDEGIELDAVKYCPHAPEEGCACRKPAPGMLTDAASELGLDLRESFMVGDKDSDVEAGRRAGCRSILFAGDWDEVTRYIAGVGAAR